MQLNPRLPLLMGGGMFSPCAVSLNFAFVTFVLFQVRRIIAQLATSPEAKEEKDLIRVKVRMRPWAEVKVEPDVDAACPSCICVLQASSSP